MPCTLKNNSFVGEMGIFGCSYLTGEGRCRCGLFPYEHPEPQQLPGRCNYALYISLIIALYIIIDRGSQYFGTANTGEYHQIFQRKQFHQCVNSVEGTV
jgi:hypothetical protein